MSLYFRILLKFVLTVMGIILAAALPALFDGIKLDVSSYISAVGSIASSIAHPSAITYDAFQETRLVFPDIWPRWEYSMTLIVGAFMIAFLFSLIVTFLTMLLPEKGRKKIRFLFFIGESIPDVLVIGLSIFTAVFLHKQMNMSFFSVVSFADKRLYFVPILVLTILPALLFYRMMAYDFEEEYSQPYIQAAKSKGLTRLNILFTHVLRNAMISIFLHAKSIIWLILSSLLMVEYAFSIDGLMNFMMDYYSPEVFAMGLLLMFVPVYIIQALGQMIIEKTTGRQVEV